MTASTPCGPSTTITVTTDRSDHPGLSDLVDTGVRFLTTLSYGAYPWWCRPTNFAAEEIGKRRQAVVGNTRPETRYVTVGDADVAYQVVGSGPIDLLYCHGLGSHVELVWDLPPAKAFLTQLASFARLIFFDRRGTGASDAVSQTQMPTWETWAEDIGAVLDAADSPRAAICASLDAAPIATLFTATHPERVRELILLNASARFLADEDYPVGVPEEVMDVLIEMIRLGWGTPEMTGRQNPSIADDPALLNQLASFARAACTPRAAAAQYDYMGRSVDVRPVLSLLQVPTLVLAVTECPFVPIDQARYLAQHIEGAKLVELGGGDIGFTSALSVVADEVAHFVTGERPVAEAERILTTILFSDIVGSTERASSLGDRAWRTLLDSHDEAVRSELRRFRGQEINTTGDGFVASFDGPARSIRCARAILEATQALGVELRIGLHTGECEVRGRDLGGLAVHIAARVGAMAGPGQVLVSGTVKDLVIGSAIEFDEWGECELKGVPGSWRLFAAVD
jgi:class 3 adenylate cyclase